MVAVISWWADTIWHKESLKLKEIFGMREGFEICPHQLSPGPIKASVGMGRDLVAHISILHADHPGITSWNSGHAGRHVD